MALKQKEVFETAVVRWDPFRDFLNIQNELGRAFERTGGEPRTGAGAWVPLVDVYEQDDHIVIKAGEIKAGFEDGVLRVTVPKADEIKPKQIKIEVGAAAGA